MSAAEAIVAEFRAFGAGRQRDQFCSRTAFDIIDRCERAAIDILGIEGFYLTDSMTMPQLDRILDLSSGPKAYDAARDFLRKGEGLPLFYEFNPRRWRSRRRRALGQICVTHNDRARS